MRVDVVRDCGSEASINHELVSCLRTRSKVAEIKRLDVQLSLFRARLTFPDVLHAAGWIWLSAFLGAIIGISNEVGFPGALLFGIMTLILGLFMGLMSYIAERRGWNSYWEDPWSPFKRVRIILVILTGQVAILEGMLIAKERPLELLVGFGTAAIIIAILFTGCWIVFKGHFLHAGWRW
jgi:hypothetical protein